MAYPSHKLLTLRLPSMSLRRAGLLIFGLFISLRLATWALIGNCTALAPDEQGYVDMFKYVQNPIGPRPALQWPHTPIFVLKILFLPASIFHSIGFSDLAAFRAQSVTLSLIIGLLLVRAMRVLGIRDKFESLSRIGKSKFLMFIVAATCTPTVIIWSILGLREVFLYLSLILLFLSIANLYHSEGRNNFLWLIPLIGSLVVLGNTKFYVYVIVLISVFVLVILEAVNKSNLRRSIYVLLITFSSMIPFTQQISEIKFPQIRFSEVHFSFNFLDSLSTPRHPSTTFTEMRACETNGTAGPLVNQALKLSRTFMPKRTAQIESQVPIDTPAATALRADDSIRNQLNLFDLPLGLVYFLFFPFSVISSGIFGVLGIVEVIFWLPLYATVLVQLYRSRSRIRKEPFAALAVTFMLIFTLFSALAEVNFGTAIRHRSLLLIPMLLLATYLWAEKKKPSASSEV